MSDDLVSKQAVIEHLSKRLYETALNNVDKSEVYTDIAENRLTVWVDELPSVQPKEKTGHWTIIGKVFIPLFRGGYEHELQYKCSECGFEHALPIPKNFCPNCGAKMEG